MTNLEHGKIAAMARAKGINPQTVYSRRSSGMSLEDALNTPVRSRKTKKKPANKTEAEPPLVAPGSESPAYVAGFALLVAAALIAYLLVTEGFLGQ